MRYKKLLQRSSAAADRGDLDSAISLLSKFMKDKSSSQRLVEYSKASLYLGHVYSRRGDHANAVGILSDLSNCGSTDIIVRGHALKCLTDVYRNLLNYEMADKMLDHFFVLFSDKHVDETTSDYKKLMFSFLNSRSLLRLQQGRPSESLADLQEAFEFILSLSSQCGRTKDIIILYINLFNTHSVLGNIGKAREYLMLAHAKMRSLNAPFAYGMTLLFENLVSHNLFIAGSQFKTIEALQNISEEVVNSFDDLRKVFDFFSSIIVQLHDGKIDVGQIRESIRDYGDDPLIKAYIPTLLYGAPPPEAGHGDDDIPAARLTD